MMKKRFPGKTRCTIIPLKLTKKNAKSYMNFRKELVQ